MPAVNMSDPFSHDIDKWAVYFGRDIGVLDSTAAEMLNQFCVLGTDPVDDSISYFIANSAEILADLDVVTFSRESLTKAIQYFDNRTQNVILAAAMPLNDFVKLLEDED